MRQRFSFDVARAAILVLGAVVCSMIWTRALIRARSGDEIIHVIGSARKPIHSDFIIWSGSISENAKTVAQGYSQLNRQMAMVQSYLLRKGLKANEFTPQAISIETHYSKPRTVARPDGSIVTEGQGAFVPVVGYKMSQSIEIRSKQVDLVERVRESTDLLGKGIILEGGTPMYLFTQMSALKVSMQAEAARDAYNRATQIAKNAGCRLGQVRFARMNVPSITPLFASSEDDGGIDDTSSMDKKITAIVVVGYSIR